MIAFVKLNKIKSHEQVDSKNLLRVKRLIIKSGIFKEPIVVDKKTLIVLDGHHRLTTCQDFGLSKIPCILVNYLSDPKIKVFPRRKNIKVNKSIVVKVGLSSIPFPNKTTKHIIPYRIKNLQIPLKQLI